MPGFVTDDLRAELREAFAALEGPVRLVFFCQKHASGAAADQRALLQELAAVSDKLSLEVHDFVAEAEIAARYGVDKVPATAVIGDRDRGVRFYGFTAGYELGSLVEAILTASTGRSGLDPGLEQLARSIDRPTHLEVVVTLTCPYCPHMVRFAHQLAFVNDHVRADMIDAGEFPAIVERYHVHGVPRTIINGRPAFEGALPPAMALLEIFKEVDPDTYERMDAAIRQARGERKVVAPRPDEVYDVLVVGAGPAGLCAALYAVRKGRRVALLGKNAGGQLNDTAVVENWLGVPRIGGRELAEAFRRHLEAWPVAERVHTAVTEVRRGADGFEVATDDGTIYRGRAVIYAAGKQYRTLGVPGEERFLGRGIAFCATCDAPLFRDRRVAVVGGGNSALTAARDLTRYAKEIHLIHHTEAFTADPVLVEELRAAPNVTVHAPATVREFLGADTLSGVRLSAAYDLPVDGVFLEIGLAPNASPVAGLLTLDAAGQIPVGRDQSTAVEGLFAAGDVTDEREKQIVVAAGDGARAGLSADRWLSRSR